MPGTERRVGMQALKKWFRPPRRLKIMREGKYFIAITIGIGFAAINTGNNLLYLILGWLLSVIIASGIMSEQVLRGLRVSRVPPASRYAGRPFLMGITLKNEKRRIPSFSIEVEDLIDEKPLDKKCFFLKIPPGRAQSTSYRHAFSRRGLYRFQGFRLSTKFPFALFRKSRDIDLPGEIIVYPEIYPLPTPAPAATHGGDEERARLGRRGEFFGLRDLRQGDDRRDVHWRSTARIGRMMVREYEEESHRRATVFLDNGLPENASHEDREALERAISLAASLAKCFLEQQYAVRLVTRGGQVPSALGPTHLVRILRTLALLESTPLGTPFAGTPDRGADNTLVVRHGQAPSASPMGMSRVLVAPSPTEKRARPPSIETKLPASGIVMVG
ncbi:MAG: DUF58 domain-containing protein [Deltaproteobacteria bacterium]|nr:DUF58 domain-containing protein [Deltaproteobacteria bacterium]